MCRCGGHVYWEIIPKGVKGRERVRDLTRRAQRVAEVNRSRRERSFGRLETMAPASLCKITQGRQDDDACRIVIGGFGLLSGCRCPLRRRRCLQGREGGLG